MKMNIPIQLLGSVDWVEKLDAWRRAQPTIPNRNEAIRRLVERGIEAYKAKKERK